MFDWVPVGERLPTEEDADAQKCVLVWHELSGCLMYHIERVEKNGFITHWMRLPGRPRELEDGGGVDAAATGLKEEARIRSKAWR